MKRAKFEIRRSENGQYYFVLKAYNGEITCQGETHTTKAMCKKSIRSVRRNALIAGFEDRT